MGKRNNLGTFRQFYATFVINLGVFGLGTVMGWTSPGLAPLRHDFKLTNWDESWISSINHLGGLAACFVGGFIMEIFGRKKSALLFTIPSILGWGLLISAKNIPMLYASRFILGFSTTFAAVVGPVLVSEISEAEIRGALSIVCGVFLTAGMLFTYIVGTFVSWKVLSIICCVVPVLSFVLILTIKESPRHMLQHGNEIEGSNSFLWYRGTTVHEHECNGSGGGGGRVFAELDAIKDDIAKSHMEQKNNQRLNLRSILTSPEALKPLATCAILMLLEQLSGFAAIVSFTAEIFGAAGIHEEKNLMAIIFGVFQFLATIVAMLFIDRFGRKPLMITGQIVMFFSLFGLGWFLNGQKHDKEFGNGGNFTSEIYRWMPLVCLVSYIVMFCVGVGSVATTLMGELLPQNIRGIGSAICTAVLRISAFGINFGFKHVSEALGAQWCFWGFASVCFVGFIFILYIPETKGLALEDIKKLYSKPS